MIETITQFVETHGHLPGRGALVALTGSTENAARDAINAYAQAHPDIPRSLQSQAGQKRHLVNASESFIYAETGDTATLQAPTGRVETLEQLLQVAQVDQDVWKVKTHTIKSYEGFSKDNDAAVVVTPLFAIAATLERSRQASSAKGSWALEAVSISTLARAGALPGTSRSSIA